MFFLGGTDFPTTRASLAAAVREGLRKVLTLPSAGEVVKIEGGELPTVQSVRVDLTGARAPLDHLPPEPRGVGQPQPAGTAETLEVMAHPVYLGEAAVDLALSARGVTFDYERDAAGRPLLVLKDAREGQVSLQVTRADLENLLLTAARTAAVRQGVQIQEANLNLKQLDPRTVGAEVRVKAKKMFVSAVITLRGRLAIDDALNATASDLACDGEGVLGGMACSVLRPQLDKVSNRVFPLTALSLGEIRLRDLRIDAGEAVKVSAAFGSQPVA